MIAYLSLGTNIGDRGYYLAAAVNMLDDHPDIRLLKSSSLYETKPWGLLEQADFWNQVLQVETSLQPLALLDVCQEIENALGRVRLIRWGPRTIDIDILIYDQVVWNDERLILPHPRLEEREFVLAPLRELQPDLLLPSGKPVRDARGEGEVSLVWGRKNRK